MAISNLLDSLASCPSAAAAVATLWRMSTWHTRSLCAVKLRFSAAQGGKEIPVGSRRTWPGYCGEVSTVKQQQQLNDCTRHTQVKRTIRELWTLLS